MVGKNVSNSARISMFSTVVYCLIIGLCCTTILGQSTTATDSQAVKKDDKPVNMITVSSFEQFVNGKNVKILYFYTKKIPRIKKFREEFEKSALYLSNYEVEFGWIDCTNENILGYCDRKGIESDIYAFKDGEMLLDLTLETMFDVNSMVSNVLQIVLLREVPILQTQNERTDYERKNKEKKLIFFGYFPAIGTQEHRIFMEVAYLYRNTHLFSLTTEKETVADLGYSKKKPSIWCIDSKADDMTSKKINKYQGKFNLAAFENFVTSVSNPKYYELNKIEDLDTNPFEDAEMHLGIIFYDSKSEVKARKSIENMSVHFRGVIGFFLCNTEKVDASALGLPENTGPLPLLAVLFHDENEPVFMDKDDIEEQGIALITKELSKRLGVKMSSNADNMDEGAESEETDENDPSEIEKQDDQVALGAYSLRKNDIKEAFTVLSEKNFIKETDEKELSIVLFHLPFDIESQAFIRIYSEAAKTLTQDGINVLSAINCFDWTDVCTKNNITSYPLIKIYRKGKKTNDYKGLLDYSAVVSTARMYLVQTPLMLHKEEDVTKFTQGQLPEDIAFFTNNSVIAMATTNKDMMVFKELAEILHGSVICGLITRSDLADQISRKYNCPTPCVVIHKRDDAYQPYHVLKQESSASKLAHLITDAKIPKFAQISVKNFPLLYARKQPIVILFGKNLQQKSGLHETLGHIASSEKFPSIIFTYIDVEEQRNLGGNLLSTYQLGTKIPCVLMININKRSIHKYKEESITENGVSGWVQQILDGAVEPDRLMESKKWIPRLAGYDYLLMLDTEDTQFPEEGTEQTADEEDNLGFDEYGEEVGHEYDGSTKAQMKELKEDLEDDIEQDLHDLKKSRLFHTRDSGSTEHNKIHSNIPSSSRASTAGSGSENGHRMHNEL